MIRALLYLRLTSAGNLIASRIRRLRQPKYLFGAIAGAAYFWLVFFRHFGPGGGSGARRAGHAAPVFPVSLGDSSALILALGAVLLLLIVALAWILPTQKPGLGFTEPETAFLFPAPVSRRALVNFKLLGSQFTILFTSLFFTLISSRWTFLRGNALTHAIGWWVILSTLNLHFTGAALTLTRLFDAGVGTGRRRIVASGAIALLVGATIFWVGKHAAAPTAGDVAETGAFSDYLVTVLNAGALSWLLLPFRLVLGPFLAADTHAFLVALAPVLLLMAAHYFWVMRMAEVSFEEASLTAAEKRTAVIARARAGQYRFGAPKAVARRSPFLLGDTGRPEFAFLWKNLLSTRPYFNVRTFAVLAAIIIVGSHWLPAIGEIFSAVKVVVIGFSLMAGAYLILLGPHLARQDLRSDLPNADILKTYPIRGWQLILGEILTPISILTGLTWLALLAAALILKPEGNMPKSFTPALQTTCAVCVAAVAPPLLALQLLVLNGATLLFPGWFQTTRGQAGGIEVMGQRLIFVFGNMVVLFTVLLPAAIAAALLIFSTQWIIGLPTAVVLATVVVLVVLVGEVWCGLWWLGERFEKFDLSAELRP